MDEHKYLDLLKEQQRLMQRMFVTILTDVLKALAAENNIEITDVEERLEQLFARAVDRKMLAMEDFKETFPELIELIKEDMFPPSMLI